MFRKKSVKSIIAAFTASVLLFTTTAFASKEKKTVIAVYNDIKIVVDGTKITPKDVDGNVVDPFIIDGTTYLPVRALANALGQGVEWNQETNSVIIGGKSDSVTNSTPSLTQSTKKGRQSVEVTTVYNDIKIVVNGSEIIPNDANGNIVEPFIIDGTTYLPVRALANALGQEVSWEQSTSTVYIGEQPFRINASILNQFADKTFITAGNTSIKGSVYNLLIAQNCNDLSFPSICDNYSSGKNLQELTILSTPAPEFLVNYVTESVASSYAIYDYAKANGFVDREDVQAALDAIYANYRNQFDSDSTFNAFLAECGISAEDYENFIKITSASNYFVNDLYSRYVSIPYETTELNKICSENYVTAKHILVSDEETALSIIKKLNDGESFDKLMQENTIDPGSTLSGYTFTYNEMVPEFEEAAFSLKENTYTKTPVKSTYGYHIIMRMPLDTDWLSANESTVIDTLAKNDTNKVIEEILSKAKIAYTSDYDNYISTIK